MPTLPTLSSIARPRQWGYEAALDDLLLRLARSPERPMSIITAPKEPDRVQTEQTAEDFLPEFGDVFSRNDFTGGEGLAFAYRPNATELDATRYWDSKGIDISIAKPGTLGGIKLLHDTNLLWSATATNLHACRLTDGTIIYADGSGTFAVADVGLGSPSRVSGDPHAGTQTVRGLASLGNTAYAALNTDKIAKRSGAGTWSNLASSPNCVGIWSAKSRLIADSGTGLIQTIDTTTGAPTTIISIDAGDTITAVCDAGAAILIATSDGSIYALTDDAGVLTLASQTRLTASDVVTAMAWASGVLFIGTRDNTVGRLWRAFIGDNQTDFSLSNAQLLKELAYIPFGAVATRDRIYIAARDSATEVALWRYQLATSSLSRDLIAAAVTAGDPVALLSSKGRLVVTVGANGFYRESSSVVPEGWLISPMADFYSPAIKVWIGLKVQAQDLVNAEVELLMATDPDALLDEDSVLWSQIGRIAGPGDVTEELLLPALTGRYGAVQIRLTSSVVASANPTLHSFALRSFSDSDDLIVKLPVNVSDYIERPGRRPLRAQGWGEMVFAALLGYDGHHVVLTLYRPNLVIRGVVEEVENPVLSNPARGSVTTYSMVTVRGKAVVEGSGAGGSGTLGVFPPGVYPAGVI